MDAPADVMLLAVLDAVANAADARTRFLTLSQPFCGMLRWTGLQNLVK
jgi:hypothetical protein